MYRLRPAERRDLAALTAIADAQAQARRRLDARLPHSAQLIPFLSSAPTLAEVLSWRAHAMFVAEQDGVVVGGINLHSVEQRERDQFASYYPRRFTSIGLLAARSDAPSHMIPDLIYQAAEQAARWKTPALLIHCASIDGPLREMLRALGFRTYYHYALRTDKALSPVPLSQVGRGIGGEGDVIIRHATRRDLDEVVRIGMGSVYYHASLEPTMQVPKHESRKMRQRFEAAIKNATRSAVFVAEQHGQVVGFYSIYVQMIDESWTPPLFAAGRYGLIAEVAVDQNFRHQGVGRKIFAEVERWFHARGVECYWLIYLPHNPLSSKFWPSLGFAPVWDVLLADGR